MWRRAVSSLIFLEKMCKRVAERTGERPNDEGSLMLSLEAQILSWGEQAVTRGFKCKAQYDQIYF